VDDVEVSYLVSAAYAPAAEGGLRHDDPVLGIAWPMPVTVPVGQGRGLAAARPGGLGGAGAGRLVATRADLIVRPAPPGLEAGPVPKSGEGGVDPEEPRRNGER
jgi:hypothetical protein